WFSSTLILKGNSLVFYFYAKKRCQWIFSTNTIYCRALFYRDAVFFTFIILHFHMKKVVLLSKQFNVFTTKQNYLTNARSVSLFCCKNERFHGSKMKSCVE